MLYRLVREKGSDLILLKQDEMNDTDDETTSQTEITLCIDSISSGRNIKILKWISLFSTENDDKDALYRQSLGQKMEEHEKIKIERYLFNKQYNIDVYHMLEKCNVEGYDMED